MKVSGMDTLFDRVQAVQSDMAAAEKAWGHRVKLIAVTKTHAPDAINPLKEAGIFDIGENRVQEILVKKPLLDSNFRIHLIGQLQTNKVKYIMDNVCQIQSVDRMSLAEEIDRRARATGKRMNVLVQVSPAGEKQKAGIPMDAGEALVRRLSVMPGLHVNGLMAVMPLSDDQEYLNGLFRGVRGLFDRLNALKIPGVEMAELSMGMSNDYRLALKNGANVIRVGTALFGTRR